MIVRVDCPGCKQSLQLSEELFGKRIKCKKCGEMFVVGGKAPSKSEESEPTPNAKSRRKKGNLTLLTGTAAALAIVVILIAGGLGLYYYFEKTGANRQL